MKEIILWSILQVQTCCTPVLPARKTTWNASQTAASVAKNTENIQRDTSPHSAQRFICCYNVYTPHPFYNDSMLLLTYLLVFKLHRRNSRHASAAKSTKLQWSDTPCMACDCYFSDSSLSLHFSLLSLARLSRVSLSVCPFVRSAYVCPTTKSFSDFKLLSRQHWDFSYTIM